MSHVA